MTFSIHDAWERIKHLFVTSSHEVADFLKPYWGTIVEHGKIVLIQAAKDAYQAAENSDAKGQDKMLIALQSFAASCVKYEIQYVESEARAFIETEVQNQKVASTGA